uniref:Uncharacterized protein n=1 Tax=Anguilla anguilla TaxID=7936 RepID=A0A0E9Y0Z6_ANGAN
MSVCSGCQTNRHQEKEQALRSAKRLIYYYFVKSAWVHHKNLRMQECINI